MRQSTRRNGAPPPDRDTLLADELGTRRKNWGVSLHVALAYPNTYAVGMSNLGFHLVYRLLNDRPDCLCERVFLEPALVARSGEPITLESGTPLGRFHMLAFAMAFENDYPHLLTMLAKARIPLQADGRDRYAPLVLAGGIAVTANPEPLAPFLDLVVLGDAEAILPALMDRYADLLAHRASRRRTIDALAQLPGVYDPAAFTPRYHPDGRLAAVAGSATPRRQLLRDFTGYPALGPIRTPRTIFSNFALVDVCRGCPRTCRFCMVRGVNQPFRFRRREDLMREIVAEVPAGVTIGLVGASLADLPGLDLLCTELLAAGYRPSLSSLRADRLTPGMIEALAATDRRTITLAPECGLPGARRMIGKSLADETLLDAVAQLCRAGIVTIKLYFMVGLPDLTPRDESAAIAALAGKVSHVLRTESRTGSPATRLAVSVAGFVPKPWTPYQWKSMRSEGDLKIAIKDLERRLKPMRGVTFLHDVPKWSRIEGLLARGDRRLAHLLLAVHECEGNWSRALRRVNLNPAFYVDRRRDHDEILPWDHLQSGEDKAALIAACGMDTPR